MSPAQYTAGYMKEQSSKLHPSSCRRTASEICLESMRTTTHNEMDTLKAKKSKARLSHQQIRKQMSTANVQRSAETVDINHRCEIMSRMQLLLAKCNEVRSHIHIFAEQTLTVDHTAHTKICRCTRA